MANTIKLKTGSGSDPSASDLIVGELAIRTDSGKIFTKKDNGSVAEITGGGGISDGDKGDITVSNGGDTFTIDNGVITSAKIADGAIVNADINASAAIDVSKISGAMPLAGGTFTGDVSFDGATAGRDIVFDRSANQLEFADDAAATFGTDDDLKITHSGSNGNITNYTGDLIIKTSGNSADDIFIDSKDDVNIRVHVTDDAIKCVGDGAVELYYDNDLHFATTADGVKTNGNLSFRGDGDSEQILFHAGDGSLQFNDGTKIKLGAGDDLQLYHSSDASYIDNSTGTLSIRSDTIKLKGKSADEDLIEAFVNGTVRLYYNNVNQFETLSNGVRLKNGHLQLNESDNMKAIFGASDDLEIYHSGSDSFIVDQGTGDLIIQGSQTKIRNTSGHPQIVANDDVVEINYDNAKKAESKSDGFLVSGELQATTLDINGNAHIDGTLTLTNDLFLADNDEINIGSSNDMKLYHDGSNSYVQDVGTGELRLASDSVVRISKGSSETMAVFTVDDACTFKFDNSTKFFTTSTGTTVGTNSDLRFNNGSWTGNSCKIQHHDGRLYIVGGTDGIIFREDDTNRWKISGSGHFVPASDSTYNIGTSSVRVANGYFDTLYGDGSNLTNLPSSSDNTKLPLSGGELTGDLITHQVRPDGNGTRSLGTAANRWSDVFTSDLHLSNKARGANEFDNTWGDYTIQEGLNDLFLKNNRTGKKYKFNLTEIK